MEAAEAEESFLASTFHFQQLSLAFMIFLGKKVICKVFERKDIIIIQKSSHVNSDHSPHSSSYTFTLGDGGEQQMFG